MNDISNFSDVLKEVNSLKEFYAKVLMGGINKRNHDFFHNPSLLEKIYNQNKESINSAEDISKIQLLIEKIPYNSEEERLYSISLNLKFDYSKLSFPLPKEFTLENKSKWFHPENVHQSNIYYFDKDLCEERNLLVATIGTYIFNKGKKNYFVINSLQGGLKIHNPLSDLKIKNNENPDEKIIEKEMKRKVHRIFGKLNNFYRTDWRVGIIRNLKEFGEKNNLEVIGQMPPVFCLFGPSFPEYTLYSIYAFNSFIKSGIALENIIFDRSPKEFKKDWKKICSKINEQGTQKIISSMEELRKGHQIFFENQRNKWLNEGKISYDECEQNCKNRFHELLETMI